MRNNEFAVEIATRAKGRVAKMRDILIAMETISSLPLLDEETLSHLKRLSNEIMAELDRFDHDLHPEWRINSAVLN